MDGAQSILSLDSFVLLCRNFLTACNRGLINQMAAACPSDELPVSGKTFFMLLLNCAILQVDGLREYWKLKSQHGSFNADLQVDTHFLRVAK